jgi:periplasmic divalent cation tolerance protein
MAPGGRVAWVETHVGSWAQARALARAAVEAGLAACANMEPIRSTYRWKGRVVRADEVRVTFTVAPRRVRALVAKVERLHPYEVPYIGWGDGLEVTAQYAAWVTDASAGSRGRPPHRRSRPAARRTR